MAGEEFGPSHQLVADRIRSKIRSGDYPVGEPIPSTAKLADEHEVSRSTVRKAVGRLQKDGVLEGRGGAAVYVRTTPEQAEEERDNAEALGQQVGEMRGELRTLADKVGDTADLTADLLDAITQFEIRLTRVEVAVGDLYAREGEEFPGEDEETGSDGTAHDNRNSA